MKTLAFIAFSTLASSSALAEAPGIIWEANANTCHDSGDGTFNACTEVTLPVIEDGEVVSEYKGISFLPEPVSETGMALIRDLGFRTLVTYSAKCKGSASGYDASFILNDVAKPAKIKTPSDLVEFQSDFSDSKSEKVARIYYVRKSEASAVVFGCHISVDAIDTLPDAKAMIFLGRHAGVLAKSSASLTRSLDQLGKIKDVNEAKDAVSEAIDRFQGTIERNESRYEEMADEIAAESDPFTIELLTTERNTLKTVIDDDKVVLGKLEKAEEGLGVSCTGDVGTCTNAVAVVSEELRKEIASIKTEIDGLLTWVRLEKERLTKKLADATGRIKVLKAALDRLETTLLEKQKEAAPEAPAPVPDPAPEN